MSVNIFTLNAIKKSLYAIKLYDTLGSYIFDYILSNDHTVDEKSKTK